jgi:DNA topoisomerase-2
MPPKTPARSSKSPKGKSNASKGKAEKDENDFTSGEIVHESETDTLGMATASDYQRFTQKQHIYEVQDTYVGSDEKTPREEYLLDLEKMTAYRQVIDLPEAVDRVFLEILSNAGDNVERSYRSGINPGKIVVTMDNKRIKIRNGGRSIPIEKHPKENVYVPELIFGFLLTSSNYDKSRVRLGCGRNGYGAKLTNVFSTDFIIRVSDGKTLYTQQWTNNMDNRSEPVLEKAKNRETFVEVEYELDFKRFKLTEYPKEAFNLFSRYVADMSLTCKVQVEFNEVPMYYNKMADYVKLYFDLPDTPPVYHIERTTDVKQLPVIEMCVIDMPFAGGCLSFANGIMTLDGGVHVDAAYKAISGSIIEHVNSKNQQAGKGAPHAKINIADIKPHIVLILSCRLPDVKFKGQTKTTLASPTPNIAFDPRLVKTMMKWKMMDRLYATLDSKQDHLLSKSDGRKRRNINIKKGKEAGEAGGPKSNQCILMVCEGDSATGYPETIIKTIKNGPDFYGYFPLRGKVLNMRNAPKDQIANNAEYCEIKRRLGIREGVDYTPDEIFNQLRYGKVWILVDSDVDGTHIAGLLENMFDDRFRSLIRRQFLVIVKTPTLRLFRGKQSLKFYTIGEYEDWKKKNDIKRWDHKYYKGLGTSTEEEIKEDCQDLKLVTIDYDENAQSMMDKAFNKFKSSERKKWIDEYDVSHLVATIPKIQTVSEFIQDEYINYIIATLVRAIPRFEDGLKDSQRKLLWSAFIKWGKDPLHPEKGLKNKLTEMKVAQFANFTGEQTDYHHGENSLTDTLRKMAANFVGMSNLNYFHPKGQFGNRHGGMKAAASGRYIFTYPEWWIPYIFRCEDFPLLERNIDTNGKPIEPVVFSPIICMTLVNGVNGIATGWSTFIPNHDPLDIVRWIQHKIQNLPTPKLIPWYRGFKGTIDIIDKSPGHQRITRVNDEEPSSVLDDNDNDNEDDGLGPDQQFIFEHTTRTMVTKGSFSRKKNGDIEITELPVGVWTNNYLSHIRDNIENGALKSVRELPGTMSDVHLLLQGVRSLTDEKLKLTNYFGMSNMVLINKKNKPVRYPSAEAIMEEYYVERLDLYNKRRQYIIKDIDQEMTQLGQKKLFIQLVVDEKIIVMKRKKEAIYEDMDKHKLPHDLLSRTNLAHLTPEDITELDKEIAECRKRLSYYKKATAEELWTTDLQEFITAYCKHYGCRYTI